MIEFIDTRLLNCEYYILVDSGLYTFGLSAAGVR